MENTLPESKDSPKFGSKKPRSDNNIVNNESELKQKRVENIITDDKHITIDKEIAGSIAVNIETNANLEKIVLEEIAECINPNQINNNNNNSNEVQKNDNKDLLAHHVNDLIKIEFGVGTSIFEDLVLKSDIFVDKSLLLKMFIEESGEVDLFTMLRRCGKTINLTMMHLFFSLVVDEDGRDITQIKN